MARAQPRGALNGDYALGRAIGSAIANLSRALTKAITRASGRRAIGALAVAQRPSRAGQSRGLRRRLRQEGRHGAGMPGGGYGGPGASTVRRLQRLWAYSSCMPDLRPPPSNYLRARQDEGVLPGRVLGRRQRTTSAERVSQGTAEELIRVSPEESVPIDGASDDEAMP